MVPSLEGRGAVRYLAIVEALADAIAAGDLQPGERLPTHRDLAWKLGLNVSTVTQAYREAARRHLVSGEVGRGTYVLAASREAALFGLKAVVPNGAAVPIDLSTNVPAVDPDSTDLAAALAAVAAEGRIDAALAYHSPALLRRAGIAGAAWLAARGLHLRPADVVPRRAQAALTAVLLQLCAPATRRWSRTWPSPASRRRRAGCACRCTASPWTARACCPRRWTAPSAPPAPGSWCWCRTCRTRPAR